MAITLEQYYNRFSPDEHYDQHLFRAGHVLQSAELNELQSSGQHRLKRVTDALFGEGDVLSGCSVVVNQETGQCSVSGGAVYVGGAVRGVPERAFTVPTEGRVNIGVYLKQTIVTELIDTNLLDPAISLRNFQEPGAARLQITPTWGYEGDGQSGDFYPVFRIEDGLAQDNNPPPDIDAISNAIARYDRQSAGGMYISSGMMVKRLPDAAGNQIFLIDSGVARVFGKEVVFPHSRRVVHPATPETRAVALEPHLATGGTERVDTNRSPIYQVSSVSVTKQVTEDIVHGVVSGAADLLSQRPVVQILSVTQGGTTYVAGTDYTLSSDQVDWSLVGDEPAPGSTYSVTYQYIDAITPTALDDTGFTVTGAVAGTLIQVSYQWAMPRFDLVCIDSDGNEEMVTGVAAVQNPRVPRPPSHLLQLAVVDQRWTSASRVINSGTRLVPMSDLNRTNVRIDTLFALVAEERLALNLTQRDSTAKKGVFTDPFLDDDMRDAGIAQTAAVFRGELTLGLDATIHQQTLAQASTLDVDIQVGAERIVIDQSLRTNAMRVNPYDAFSPIPAVAELSPAVDFWTEFNTVWTSPVTRQVDEGDTWINPEDRSRWMAWGAERTDDMAAFEAGHTFVTDESTVTQVQVQRLGSTSVDLQFLRQIEVAFELKGFGPGETLNEVVFDGVSVAFSE